MDLVVIYLLQVLQIGIWEQMILQLIFGLDLIPYQAAMLLYPA
jgi:hypothetical protein